MFFTVAAEVQGGAGGDDGLLPLFNPEERLGRRRWGSVSPRHDVPVEGGATHFESQALSKGGKSSEGVNERSGFECLRMHLC